MSTYNAPGSRANIKSILSRQGQMRTRLSFFRGWWNSVLIEWKHLWRWNLKQFDPLFQINWQIFPLRAMEQPHHLWLHMPFWNCHQHTFQIHYLIFPMHFWLSSFEFKVRIGNWQWITDQPIVLCWKMKPLLELHFPEIVIVTEYVDPHDWIIIWMF